MIMDIDKVTTDQVAAWVGSDNLHSEYLLGLIVDLVNEDYETDVMRHDVLSYDDNWVLGRGLK